MNKQVKPYECGDVDDLGYPDGLTSNPAVAKLRELKDKKQPFFWVYDHRQNPYEAENTAVANPDIVKMLMPLLEKGNTGIYDTLRHTKP